MTNSVNILVYKARSVVSPVTYFDSSYELDGLAHWSLEQGRQPLLVVQSAQVWLGRSTET